MAERPGVGHHLAKDQISMNLSEELQKLADLHRAGQLTDEEFASAKTHFLAGETMETPPAPAVLAAPPPRGLAIAKKTYRSSRWSAGNLFFPDQLTLAGDGM